jgi:5-formyltetrahydrofolate cyclo-ligase
MPSEDKAPLRQRCKEIRTALGDETRRMASLAICAQIESWEIFQRASTILTYMPIRGEVDLSPLLASRPQKRWLLPRIIPAENHRMAFHPYDPARLIIHKFGMAEPAPDLPEIHPAEVELALVPGLAYDRAGWRLGYGGGYYDRFLEKFNGITLGATFQALLLDSLPHQKHDIPMQWIVTENGIFPIQTA